MPPSSSSRKRSRSGSAGITAIALEGYKSLVEPCRVEVRPLTILAGANSSGKSSLVQPLLLLKQTLEAAYDPGALLLHGPNVRLTSTEQFFSKVGRTSSDRFAITVKVDGTHTLCNVFRKQRQGLELHEMMYGTGKASANLRHNMSHNEIVPALPRDLRDLHDSWTRHEKGHFEWQVERIRCFLTLRLTGVGVQGGFLVPLFQPAATVDFHLRRLIHVPGLRGNPERTYKTTAVGDEFPGTFEPYVASVIHHWQHTKDPRLPQLGHDLAALGLTWKVGARQVDDVQVELRVGRLPSSRRGGAMDMVSIADVGFGVSQILPVLVALLTAAPGQLVYIEQPEIHLHPRAQGALASTLAAAAERGVRVVIETHSATLLLAVQTLVAEGKLASDKVKLHWFTRLEDGVTSIASTDLDAAGAFGDWPEDFATVALDLESRYLDAAESHSLGR